MTSKERAKRLVAKPIMAVGGMEGIDWIEKRMLVMEREWNETVDAIASAIEAAVIEEREACAKMVEDENYTEDWAELAFKIRRRGQS